MSGRMIGEALLAVRHDDLTERWVVELLRPNDGEEGRVPVAWKATKEDAQVWASLYWRHVPSALAQCGPYDDTEER